MFNLKYTTAYKESLGDTTRIGQHNYVVTRGVENTPRTHGKIFDELSETEREQFDIEILTKLIRLDNSNYSEMGAGIVGESTFEDFATVVEIYGQGCDYPTGKGVDGFQVDFDVIAFKKIFNDDHSEVKIESKEFHIVLQSEDRSDNIEAYNGYEMGLAVRFGCDEDESAELREFLEDGEECEEFNENLVDRAEKLCKEWLESCIEDAQ